MTDPTTMLPPKKRTAIASEGVVYHYHHPPRQPPSKDIFEKPEATTATAATTPSPPPPPPPPPPPQLPISLISSPTRPRAEVSQYPGGGGTSDVTSVTTCASPSEKEAPSSILSDDYLHRHSSNSEPRDRTSPVPWSRYDSPYDAQSEHECRHKSSHIWRVLAYMTFLSPALSFVNLLYTLCILLFVIVSYPIKQITCSSVTTFSQHLTRHATPPLILHLHFLYPQPRAVPAAENFSATKLILVHFLSPFVALPFSAAAFCLMFVWLYTEVLLGDTNDREGMEYKCFCLTKRRWEDFLLVALKA